MRSHRLAIPVLVALFTAGCADPFGTLRSPLRAPDLQAISVFFEQLGSDRRIDTVAAGEVVMVMVRTVCAGEFFYYQVAVTANGDTVSNGEEGCSGDGRGWGAGGMSWSPPGPGAYHFMAVLDADNRFAETNEANNTATGTLVVLP